jgi:hypothetical protein
MRRLCLAIAVVSLFGSLIACAVPSGTQPPRVGTSEEGISPQALQNLKAQAEEAGRAGLTEDHEKMADLTHPTLVEKFGGRAKYVKKLESVAAQMKQEGFQMKKVTIGEPSKLVQTSGVVYAVVPMQLEMAGPRGSTGKKDSYLIASSQDRGAAWTFIDGAGIGSDRGKVKLILPSFPDQLELPPVRPPVWDKK